MGGRKSGDENFHAEDWQGEDVFSWASANGHQIVRVWPELNRSGAKWHERTEFRELLGLIQAGRPYRPLRAPLSRSAPARRIAPTAPALPGGAPACPIRPADDINTCTQD